MYNIDKNIKIGIAGTVGVGKTTFANKIGELLDLRVMHENVDNNPYLFKYYENFERWGFHLQIFFLAERFKAHKKMFEYGTGFIQDRTIYEDYAIFAKMNYEKGQMSEDDYNTYKSLFEAMVLNPFFEDPDLVIFLEADIDSVIDRINLRGRDGETTTDIDYWHELHSRYSVWVDTFSNSRLLRININDYDVNDEKSMELIIEKIANIMSK